MADIITVSQEAPVEEINTNEVLEEYGLEDVQDAGTVVQSGNNTITIPTNNSNDRDTISTLEPPPVDTVMEETIIDLDEEVEDWVNDVIGESVSESANAALENILNTEDSVIKETSENQESIKTPPDNKLNTEEALKYLLPINTKSVEIDETTSRFSGAAWFSAIQQSTVVMAGMGGIGRI